MIVSIKFTFMPDKKSSNTMHDPVHRCDTVPLTQLLKTLVSIIIRMYRVLHNFYYFHSFTTRLREKSILLTVFFRVSAQFWSLPCRVRHLLHQNVHIYLDIVIVFEKTIHLHVPNRDNVRIVH